MPIAAVNGIEIAYETIGSGSRTVVLLPGASCQMLEWLDPFCEMITGEDCTVVRVDNRDVGLSTHFDVVCPNPAELMAKAETTFMTGESPCPIERTLLTTGLVEACVQSANTEQARVETPHLAIVYDAIPRPLFAHD